MVYPQSLLFSSSVLEKIYFDDKTMCLKFHKGKSYLYEIDEHFLNELLLTECSVGEVFNRYKPSLKLI